MDKEILYQYIDACELVRETEADIRRLERRRKETVHDLVKGSMHEFPYTSQRFQVHGLEYKAADTPDQLEREGILLAERKAAAKAIKAQVETWMLTIPQRMQRIIRYRVFDCMTWAQVATKMGRNVTADSVRKEYEKFMKIL